MNQNLAITQGRKSVPYWVVPVYKRLMVIAALTLVGSAMAMGQDGDMQQKLAAAKQSIAENQQKLRQYQWTETTELTLKGDPKPPTQKLCQYGPDGKVQKTPIGPPPPPPSGGRAKQRIIANKTAEMKDYMGDVQGLLSMYVPPNPQKMQQVRDAGNFSLNPAGGVVNLVFANYAQPGDKLTLTFDPATKKVTALAVNTYMGETKDAVTLQVQMGSLPDGTNYAWKTVLGATAKQLVVTTTNSDYQKLGGN